MLGLKLLIIFSMVNHVIIMFEPSFIEIFIMIFPLFCSLFIYVDMKLYA